RSNTASISRLSRWYQRMLSPHFLLARSRLSHIKCSRLCCRRDGSISLAAFPPCLRRRPSPPLARVQASVKLVCRDVPLADTLALSRALPAVGLLDLYGRSFDPRLRGAFRPRRPRRGSQPVTAPLFEALLARTTSAPSSSFEAIIPLCPRAVSTSPQLCQGFLGPQPDLPGERQRLQLVSGEPADVQGLPVPREPGVAHRHGEVHQVDVLVSRRDGLHLHAPGDDQLPRIVDGKRPFAHEAYVDAGFLPHLPYRRLVGQLVGFDVPAGRQPLGKLGVMQQEDPSPVDDEGRDGEIPGDAHGRLPPSGTRGPRGLRSNAKALLRIAHPNATNNGVTRCVRVKKPIPQVSFT